MTDKYGNDIEIFYDEEYYAQTGIKITTGMEIITPGGGAYIYSVEEMQGSENLLALLRADGVDLEHTVYSQTEEMEYSDLSEEDKEYIRRNF